MVPSSPSPLEQQQPVDITERLLSPLPAHAAADWARDFLQSTLDSLPSAVAVLDERGVVVLTNDGWERRAIGLSRDLTVGSDLLANLEAVLGADPTAAGGCKALRETLAGERERFELDYRRDALDGERWYQLRGARHRTAGSTRVVLQHDDITCRRLAERDADLRGQLLDEVDAAVVATNAATTITYWNRGAERLYGWTARETIGRAIGEVGIFAGGRQFEQDVEAVVRREGRWEGRCENARRTGETFPSLVRLCELPGDGDEPAGIIGVGVDITHIARAEQELRLTQSLSRAVTESMGEGLCAVDDHGRLIYMNPAAEEMLGWSLAELTGRVVHFVIHGHRPDGSPLPPEECPIMRTRAEGVTIRVEDDTFIRRDGTMLPVAYTASPFETAEGLRGAVYVFCDITDRKARQADMRREMERLAWIPRIADALADDRMLLHAQPIIALDTGETVQHELLIRMKDADGTLVPPGLFLPVAEEHGLIRDIDRWVIRQGMRLAAKGHAIELNLSAHSLADSSLIEYVERELRASGADPARVCIELTETALLHDEEAAGGFISHLEALGCHFALDDFGTGYGGFTYLKRFPVQFLKIDVEFVRDLPRDPASQHVVRAVVDLARAFGQKTIAEGVEDEETLHLLADMGVDLAQGYHIGRPAPLGQAFGDACG